MISDNLKAALSRIVETVAHLKSASVPTAHKPTIDGIRLEAAKTAQSSRDPQIEAAERWALAEVEKALGLDAALTAPPETPDAPPLTGGNAEPGVPSSADNPVMPLEFPDGVPTVPDPIEEKPLGELTDAELETLTKPE